MNPITFTNVTSNQQYCQVADVLSLIGNVAAISNGDVTTAQITTAINAATSYIEAQTNRFFSPRRIVKYIDGNGKPGIQLPNRPIMNINNVTIYVTYPISVSVVANDWDLRIDREAGLLTFPLANTGWPTLAPFSNLFLKGSQNIIVDALYGFNKVIYGDTLYSSNQKNYYFSNPTAFVQSRSTVATTTTPPIMFPNVYLNGVLLQNTTYALDTNTQVYTASQWQIATDNIYYTFISSANGLNGIVFNNQLQSTDVITADYPYWYIPADIIDITAKKAAVSLLSLIATTGGFSQAMFQGASQLQMDSNRIQYQNGGQFGESIANWKAEIAEVIASRKKLIAPYGLGE